MRIGITLNTVVYSFNVSSVRSISDWYNVVALSLNGNGAYNTGAQSMPSIANNGGSGVTGDVLLTNASASVGTIWLKFRKTSGYDNLQ